MAGNMWLYVSSVIVSMIVISMAEETSSDVNIRGAAQPTSDLGMNMKQKLKGVYMDHQLA